MEERRVLDPLAQTLVAVGLEAEARPIRARRLEVLDHAPRGRRAEPPLVLPGAITVFVARAGAPLLAELRAALSGEGEPDPGLLDRVAGVYRQIEARPQVDPAEALEVLRAQPVFADLRYGGATLATGVFVPEEGEVGVLILPYNGGRLARWGFTWVEHVREDGAALEALVVRHAPPLTRAEAAALRMAPADQAELNVGLASFLPHAGVEAFVVGFAVGIAVGAVVIAVARAVHGGVEIAEHLHHHRADDVIRDLGPAATARELLRIRRDVLEGTI